MTGIETLPLHSRTPLEWGRAALADPIACAYAKALRLLVRKGGTEETLDRLLVSALIEARSCERFAVLAEAAAEDAELAVFYKALFSSEMGHYKVFLKLANRVAEMDAVESRWQELLTAEARIIAEQTPGPRIHSGPSSY